MLSVRLCRFPCAHNNPPSDPSSILLQYNIFSPRVFQIFFFSYVYTLRSLAFDPLRRTQPTDRRDCTRWSPINRPVTPARKTRPPFFFFFFIRLANLSALFQSHHGRTLYDISVFGFAQVIMGDRPAAERACKEPNPIIDGRKANVNLAILGAKPRGNLQPGKIIAAERQPQRLPRSRSTAPLTIRHDLGSTRLLIKKQKSNVRFLSLTLGAAR